MMRLKWLILNVFFIAAVSLNSAWAARDIPSIAYDITRRDLNEEAWRGFVRRATSVYKDWLMDNPSGGLKRFLDDRLLQYATGVPKGQVETLQRFIHWLSLYKEWQEIPPKYIREFADENWADLDRLCENWSWDKAVELVNRRKKEYDEGQEKKEEGGSKKKDGDKLRDVDEREKKDRDKIDPDRKNEQKRPAESGTNGSGKDPKRGKIEVRPEPRPIRAWDSDD